MAGQNWWFDFAHQKADHDECYYVGLISFNKVLIYEVQQMSDDINQDDLLAVYSAVVDYHNNLVHMRFTVAGLYIAASGFLVGAIFSGCNWGGVKLSVTLLGITLTAIAWLLEIRTYHLLENLGSRGIEIEKKLRLGGIQGFFGLMAKQPLPPRLPFIRMRLTRYPEFVRYVISHSLGLDILYLCLAMFWVFILLFYR